MKLAEALIERAEIQRKNGQLIDRIKNNTRFQEGDVPAENPEELIAEYEENMKRFLVLVKRINDTNCKTPFEGAMCIADAIAERDYLGLRIKAYREFYDSAVVKRDNYYRRNEIRTVSNSNPRQLQERINELSKEYRELDTKLQSMNWTVDLM